MRLLTWTTAVLALAQAPTLSGVAGAQSAPSTCNAPSKDPTLQLEMPGTPFEPVVTRDGCWLFVTLTGGQEAGGQVAVVRRDAGSLRIQRVVPIKGNPTAAVLTHDGSLLVIADGAYLAFLDPRRLISGDGDPVLGYMGNGAAVGFINVNVTRDDGLLFAAAERAASIQVVDLPRARATGFDAGAVIGTIPTGEAPIAIEFSPDQKLLYGTSEGPRVEWGWPRVCKPLQQPPPSRPPIQPPSARNPRGGRPAPVSGPRRGAILTAAEPYRAKGTVMVVDVATAAKNPANAVRSIAAAGCGTVRLELSPDGATVYASARGDDALLAFDSQRLLTDTAHALIGRVNVGSEPVGVAVVDSGGRIFVTNSNRFQGGEDDRQPVAIVDAARLRAGGKNAKVGTVAAGAFPRELRVTADGQTLFVTNFRSRTLEMIDLARAH